MINDNEKRVKENICCEDTEKFIHKNLSMGDLNKISDYLAKNRFTNTSFFIRAFIRNRLYMDIILSRLAEKKKSETQSVEEIILSFDSNDIEHFKLIEVDVSTHKRANRRLILNYLTYAINIFIVMGLLLYVVFGIKLVSKDIITGSYIGTIATIISNIMKDRLKKKKMLDDEKKI